jgi:hypothetical protein
MRSKLGGFKKAYDQKVLLYLPLEAEMAFMECPITTRTK